MVDQGLPCGAEANMAKYLCAEAGFFAADVALQIHGGFGYGKEFHVERYFREARLHAHRADQPGDGPELRRASTSSVCPRLLEPTDAGIPVRPLRPRTPAHWVDKAIAQRRGLPRARPRGLGSAGGEGRRPRDGGRVDRPRRETNSDVGLLVRVNPLATRLTGADLEAVVVPGLTGVFAPKIEQATDVLQYDALLDHFEWRNGVTGLEYIVPVETIEGDPERPGDRSRRRRGWAR